LTVEAVFWPTGIAATYASIVAFQSTTINSAAQLILYFNANSIAVGWYTSGGTYVEVRLPGSFITVGAPYHVVAVKDTSAKTVTFIVNGHIFPPVTYTTECSATATPVIQIGTSKSNEAFSIGSLIAHVALYSSKLSTSRVLTHAKSAGLYAV
jgi:hypothetical protein